MGASPMASPMMGGAPLTMGAPASGWGLPRTQSEFSAGAEGDGVARSVTSGIESERSAASTHLAELATEMNETQTSHLDNLMGLNERNCGAEPMESQ